MGSGGKKPRRGGAATRLSLILLAAVLACLFVGIACSGNANEHVGDDKEIGASEPVANAQAPLRVQPHEYPAGSNIADGNRIAIGSVHTCASLGDGQHAIKCWGQNSNGRLGYGDTMTRGDQPGEMGDTLPLVRAFSMNRFLSRIRSISIYGNTTCAVVGGASGSGLLRCWGANDHGQLGLGDTNFRSSPENFPTVELEAEEVSVGSTFVCRRNGAGEVRCLGLGPLGCGPMCLRGGTPSDLINEPPIPLGTGLTAKQIAASSVYHACALLSNGQVKCWGMNFDGVLGLGDGQPRGLPADLGDNLPAVDLGTGRTAKALAVAGVSSCALLDNNQVKCWGNNWYGNLGLGDQNTRGLGPNQMGDNLPAVDFGAGLYALQISSGSDHYCALLNNHQVKCWGGNDYGILGLGDVNHRGDSPGEMGDNLPAVDLGTIDGQNPVVDHIYSGYSGNCATYHSALSEYKSGVKCWGRNASGGLGLGDTLARGDSPTDMGNNLPPVNLGTIAASWTPTPVGEVPAVNPGGTMYLSKPIAANGQHTCAILGSTSLPATQWEPGYLKCWGDNTRGQLGLGDTNNRGDQPGEMLDALPFVDLGTNSLVREVAAGTTHTCAILATNNDPNGTGPVKCWGTAGYEAAPVYLGALGYGDTVNRGVAPGQMGNNLPTVDLGTGRTARHIAAGRLSTCALLDNNTVKCWGYNFYGQLGQGHQRTIGDQPGEMGDALPAVDLGTTAPIKQLVAGSQHYCVVLGETSPHNIKCWGANWGGQLGIGDPYDRGAFPGYMGTNLPYVGVTGDHVAAGYGLTCVTNAGGQGVVKCWGFNEYGQLGLGDTLSRGDNPNEMGANLPAVPIPGVGPATEVYANEFSVCVITRHMPDGRAPQLVCFGTNESGQLGIGDVNTRGDQAGEVAALPFIDLGFDTAQFASVVAMRSCGVCAVSAATGQIKCWGNNDAGQLGLGDTVTRGDGPGEMGNALPFAPLGSELNLSTSNPCAGQDDDNSCTTDTCDAVMGVTHTHLADRTSCNDNNACTASDGCTSGSCTGSAIATDDANPCTSDSCDPATGVKHELAPAGTVCNDNNQCTTNDACSPGGTCAGTSVVLPPATQCTYSVCTPSGGIATVNAPTGTACNADDSACTVDTCNGAGACMVGAIPAIASDGNVCTLDLCDPLTGNATYPPAPKGSACGDVINECDGAGRCAPPLGTVLVAPEGSELGVIGQGSVAIRTAALYSGADAIQKKQDGDTAPFVFDQKRVSVLQGRVLATDSLPLANVRITIKDHPEYGYTQSRVDGKFDMVVEGGGQLTVDFARANYLPVQRTVRVEWDRPAAIEDVVLTAPDLVAEPPSIIPLCTTGCNVSAPMSIHVGATTAADAHLDQRGAVMLFPASTQAQLNSSQQTPASMSSLSVATTEYTRDVPTGEGTALPLRDARSSGTLAMPGELPPASGYTYAVDLFESALLSDSTANVTFSGAELPILYVDNFVGFEVGTIVPVGSYDRMTAAWKPESSGRVLKILATNPGTQTVALDSDGDGLADIPSDVSPEELNALYRLTAAEYSGRFAVGDTIWRVRIAHFSPWDLNWPFGPPGCDQGGPCRDDDPGAAHNRDSMEDKPNCKPGSIIMCESRVLGESIPIAGTGWNLVYASNRVPGYRAPLEVELTPPANNRSKSRWMSAATYVGDSSFEHGFFGTVHVPAPKDRLGRSINGTVNATTEIVEHYPAIYNPTGTFGLPPNGPSFSVLADRTRAELKVVHRYEYPILTFDARTVGLGGWDLSIHHWLDRAGGWVFKGDGTHQKVASPQNLLMDRAKLGTAAGASGHAADGANWSALQADNAMTFAPNGDLFLVSSERRLYQVSTDRQRVPCTDPSDSGPCIRWVGYDGNVNIAAHVPADGSSVPARSGRTDGLHQQIVVARDGSIYQACHWGIVQYFEDKTQPVNSAERWRMRKIAGSAFQPTELYRTPIQGIGAAAVQSQLIGRPRGIAVGADGAVYVMTFGVYPGQADPAHVLLKIDSNGILRTIIGGGTDAFSKAGLPKDAYELQNIWGKDYADMRLAMSPNGDIYFGQDDLYVLRGDGRVDVMTQVGPTQFPPNEGVLATSQGTLNAGMEDVAVTGDGAVILIDIQLNGVRRIDQNGVISTLSGITAFSSSQVPKPAVGGQAVPARGVRFLAGRRLALAPNGDIYVGDYDELYRIFHPSALGGNAACPWSVPSTDGEEVYCFDELGRHLTTRHARTCVNKDISTCDVKYSFAYEDLPSSKLVAVTDGVGNVTTLTRTPSQVQIAPSVGSPSTLLLDSETAYLTRVTDPAAGSWIVSMSQKGLLQRLEDPRGTYRHEFTYDSLGKLNTDALVNMTTSLTEASQELVTLANADNQLVKNPDGTSKSPTTYANTVTHTSAEGLPTKYEVLRENSGRVVRTTTLPTGLVRSTTEGADGSVVATEPDLVTWTSTRTTDPLFGLNAPLTTVTTRYPSGRTVVSRRDHAHEAGMDSVSLSFGPNVGEIRTATQLWTPMSITGQSPGTLESTSPAGRKFASELDGFGRVTSIHEDGFAATNYFYADTTAVKGTLSRVVSRGANTQFDYYQTGDAKGYLLSVATPGSTTSFDGLNALGLPSSQTTVGAGLTAPIVSSFGWDAIGNMASLTPPVQPAHGQTFNGFNQLASYDAPSVATVASTRTSFTYDADRNLRRITRPGRAPISFENSAGRLDYVLLGPLQNGDLAVDVEYYSASETTNGASPGRVKHIAGVGPIASVAPLSISTASPKLTYTYDGSLPLSESYSGPITGEVSRTYDPYLNADTQTVKLGAVTSIVSYTTDADGVIDEAEVSGVSTGLQTVHDPLQNHRLTSATVGSTTASLAYDTYGALASLAYASGAVALFQAQYDTPRGGVADPAATRDALGRVWKAKETRTDGTHTYEYGYDGAGRLTSVSQDNVLVESYSYDGNGNRSDLLAGTAGTTYDAQDRLISYAQSDGSATRNWSFAYRDDGSLSALTDTGTGNVTRYGYDALGNLSDVELGDGTVIEYIIDGRGRRIGKKRDGVLAKAWLYDGQLRIAAELDIASNVVSRFVYGTRANIPDYMVKYTGATVTGVYRIVADHLGSPRMVVDVNNAANKLLEARYSAFGIPSLINSTGSLSAVPFGFAGGLYDADTGLVRFGARDYDPVVGRWTNKDPILFGGSQTNLYAYVGNDPVNWTDPEGLLAGVPEWLENLDNSGWLQAGGDFAAGVSGALTFGASDLIIGATGLDAYGSECSTARSVGEWTGHGLQLAGGLRGLGSKAVRNNWFRVDPSGRWKDISTKQWRSGPHFHADPIRGSKELMRWHLPSDWYPWYKNLTSILRR